MLAPLIAALALAGAPAGTTVQCDTTLPYGGLAAPGDPPAILLGEVACRAALLAAASPQERLRIRVLNNGSLYPDGYAFTMGDGLLVVLHEASHVSGLWDETDAECNAMRLLPGFLARYVSRGVYDAALRHVREYNDTMPANYHDHPCDA